MTKPTLSREEVKAERRLVARRHAIELREKDELLAFATDLLKERNEDCTAKQKRIEELTKALRKILDDEWAGNISPDAADIARTVLQQKDNPDA